MLKSSYFKGFCRCLNRLAVETIEWTIRNPMSLQLFERDQIDVQFDDASEDVYNPRNLASLTSVNRLRHSLRRLSLVKLCKISLTHWSLLITWLLLLLRFTSIYRRLYDKSALLATMCTNVLLFGISDSMAQSILCYFSTHVDPVPQVIDGMFSRLRRPPIIDDDNESDNLSVFNDYGETTLESEPAYDFSAPDAHKFAFFRWSCFMLWGFILSFFQVPWYKFLNYFYTEDPTVVQVLERVLCDQLLYSPISLYSFFMYSNYVMEGGDAETFSKKIQVLYLSTLGCNYLVWPLVQFLNFLVVPKHFQVPFSSSVGIVWNCFLSMRNASNSIK